MSSVEELAGLVARLEAVAGRLEASAGGEGGDGAAGATVEEYDNILGGNFKQFSDLCSEIGGDVATVGQMLQAAFKAQREFLVCASKCRKPEDKQLQSLLKPTSDKISEIQAYRESNRRSEFFNHLSAISESVPALGWVLVAPTPAPYIKEMNDAGQFYTNRVLKDWKEKAPCHSAWVKAWIASLTELQGYVKRHHTTGLVWNPKGGAVPSGGAGGPPPPPAGGPPPPPGPPPPSAGPAPSSGGGATQARGALLESLNKGADITKGLRKVDKSEMTHKNPSLRGEGLVKAKESSAPASKTYGKAVEVNKPPRFELNGKKWEVEYYKNKPDLVIDGAEANQSVYVFKCEGSTVKVNGKCNNIIIDSCKKVAVVFDTVVSSVEFINCQSVQMQVLGKVPTISVEKTDGCQMFINKESVGVEIVTAKSSEMNVMIPVGDDFMEQPVPEQFKTVINGGKLKTTATESV